MPPQRSYLILSTNIPDVEFCVLVCDGLDVEAYSRDCRDILVELQLIQYC